MKDIKNNNIVILGPTASGKTALAIALAKEINGEIVSADSRQVYCGMDVGTGKDLELYNDVKYHLINILKAGEKYNLAGFIKDARKIIFEILERNKKVIVCGGTGLYIQALIENYFETQIPDNPGLRDELLNLEELEFNRIISTYGINKEEINSKKRIIRAIEKQIYLEKNKDFKLIKSPELEFTVFGLSPETETRRQAITKRLKQRLETENMLGEVEMLLKNGVPAETLKYYGLEYKYLTMHILGEMSYSSMVLKLETEIHRFAKRQMTFFRSMQKKGIQINWIPFKLSLKEKLEFIKTNL